MRLFIFLIISFLTFNTSVKAVSSTDVSNLLNNTNNIISSQSQYESLNKRYPVGSIYISTSGTNPSSLFGGTWQAYAQGRKLVASGSNGTTNYTSIGSTGGNKTVTLSVSNLPSHTHSLTPSGTVSSSFSGKAATTTSSGNHFHQIPFGKASNEAKGYGLIKTNSGYNILYTDRAAVTNRTDDNMTTNGAHTHTLTPSGSVTSTFKGNTFTTSSTGGTTAIDVMNPYITVYIWRRTA